MKFSFYFSLLFLIAYLAFDVLMADGSKDQRPIVQLFAGLVLLSMLFYNLIYIKKLKKIFSQWTFLIYWGGFILLIVLYYIISLLDLPTAYSNSLFRNVVIAIFIYVTIIFIYISTINKQLRGMALFLLIGALFINGLFEIYNAFTFTKIKYGVEQINTSAGYVFVMMLPMLMYQYRKNNLWVFGLTLILTLLTGKRGAVLIYVVLGGYLLLHYSSIKKQKKLNWKTFLFVAVSCVAIFLFYEMALESFQSRITNIRNERGAIGSGRSIFWALMLYHWLDSNLLFQIIGSGFYSTISVANKIAHNDFIQYLVDYGLIGISFWLFILYKFYDNLKEIENYDRYLYTLLIFCVFILIGRGMFAGTIRTDNIYLSISIGYLLGIYQLNFGRFFIRLEGIKMQSVVSSKINAFIIGAQKAGTTSLYNWLGQHPEVQAPSEVKDYHFFSKEDFYRKGNPHLEQFYTQVNFKVNLHAAVNYLYFYKKCAKRIHQYNPDSKIIICLRNPVDRAVSAYKYFVRSLEENRSFEEAISMEISGELSKDELSDFTYLSHGLYLEQIEGYLKYFNRDQIHIVLFEELTDNNRQKEIVEDVLDFLNLDTSVKLNYTHMNKSAKPKNQFLIRLIRKSKLSILINFIIPIRIRKKIGKMLIERNISDEKLEINISDKVRKKLIRYYRNPVKELSFIMDKDLSTFWNIHSHRE